MCCKKIFFLCIICSVLFSCKNNSHKVRQSNYIDDERFATDLILGFSQIGSESAWREVNTKSVLDAAAENGIQVLYDDAQQKQANQLKAIRSFIVYRVDVIAFVPIIETGWDNVLREAKEARIPVIIVDRQIKTSSPDLYEGFIGEDSYGEGKFAAEFLLKKFSEEKNKFNIMEIRGTENSSVAKLRGKGFRDVLLSNDKFKIIYSDCGDFLKSRGKEIMENLIESNGGLNVNGSPINIIFSHNDAMTLGLLESLEKNKLLSPELTIISVDGEAMAIQALKDKKISCVVECNPRLGNELMKLVKTVANHNKIPVETYISGSVFTENDDLTDVTGF